MTSRGALACAHARIRAAKSRLLTRSEAAPLLTAPDAPGVARAVAALGVEPPMPRVVRVYETALRGYAEGRPLLHALLARHEVENLKLLWRGALNGMRAEAVRRVWLDLGPLASFPFFEPSPLHELASKLARTPYGAIAATAASVHGEDLAAAELAFDRWVTKRLADEAGRLAPGERIARKLIELLILEREGELIQRGAKSYGLTVVAGKVDDVASIRRQRLRLCRAAFVGSPFALAPAIAVVLLAEEEMRSVEALTARGGDSRYDEALRKAMAASEMGA